MNTKQVNLSSDFQIYDNGKLVGSFKQLEEARRFLTKCGYTAALVYPRREIERENVANA